MSNDMRTVQGRSFGSRGFTLIEMMITVAIVGILASMAYSSYDKAVIKGNRASAKSFLMDIAQKEQQYLLDARSYTATQGTGGLGLPTPAEVSRFYTITLATTATPPGFTATATPKTGTKQANDGTLIINQAGAKTGTAPW